VNTPTRPYPSWMTLDANRKRSGGNRSTSRMKCGPGRLGLGREKEAAGAARRVPLPMGFECCFFELLPMERRGCARGNVAKGGVAGARTALDGPGA